MRLKTRLFTSVRHLIRTIFAFFKLFIPFSYLPRDPSFHSKLLLTCMLFIIHSVLLIRKLIWFLISPRKFSLSRILTLFYLILYSHITPKKPISIVYLLTIDSFIYFSKNFHTFQPPKIPSFPTKKKKKSIKLRNR